MTNQDRTRMIEWLLAAALFYCLAFLLAAAGDMGPIQTAAWKMGNATVGSYLGYRFDRALFRDRITRDSSPLLHLRRAIVVVGTMHAIGMGL